MKIKGFITHKLSESFSDCQDRFRVNGDTKSIALSDGMSQSFLQAIWADLLCEEFTDTERWEPSDDMALSCIREKWRKQCDEHLQKQEKNGNPYAYLIRNAIKNNASAGATFLGVRFCEKDLKYWVLGDSCLIHVRNGKIESLESIISSQDGDFDSFPDFFDSDSRKKSKGTIKDGVISLSEGNVLLLVSDPFSDFFYGKVKSGETCEDYISQIMDLESHVDFERLVSDWRNEGMANDDSTMIVVEYDGDNDFNHPNVDVIYELIEEESLQKETEREKDNEKIADNEQEIENVVLTDKLDIECSDHNINEECDQIYQRLQRYDCKTICNILKCLWKKLEKGKHGVVRDCFQELKKTKNHQRNGKRNKNYHKNIKNR